MTLNTIFANKLGLLIDSTRNEPRDLFDIYFLLQHINLFDFDFSAICRIFKEKYGFNPSLNLLTQRFKNNSLKLNWHTRLNKQVAKLPDIQTVIADVEKKLATLFEW